MAGISEKALKTPYAENKYRFNKGTELQNKEFFDGSGLELYTTDHRLFDPQLGKFVQVDAFAGEFENLSPYNYAVDNPALLNDPSGLISDSTHPQDLKTATVTHTTATTTSSNNVIFADPRPLRRNPNYILGNQPAFIPYTQTRPEQWDPAKTKQFVQIAGPALSLLPIGRGVKALYTLYKAAQYLKEAELEADMASKSLEELRDIVKKDAPLFRDLFGVGKDGAQTVLDNIDNVEVPNGLSRESMQAYRELINRVPDPVGTQEIRAKILDELLK